MFSRTKSPAKQSINLFAGLTIVALMGATAFASKSFVQDRRITMVEAERMVEKAKRSSDFPIAVNELVLKELNRYIGTPEGREYMQKALQRMESYKPMLEEALRAYNVPKEIMAMPIVESAYRNLPQSPTSKIKGAGVWQFIPQTARNYGLQVNEDKDERLDPAILTDAAMRYLLANRHRFKDWLLSIHAFNLGEEGVQKGINKTGSRDVWTLIRKGYEGDKNYSARVMAAIIILKNPESVQ